jgi:uncharacterized membrane protein (DUF106 family)
MVEILSLIQQNPKASIIVIALAISFFISLINYFFLDKEKMREMKKRQKEIQKKMKDHQKNGDHDKALELNKEFMTHSMEIMKQSLKPTLITIVPIIVVFSIIRNAYAETAIASTWFWWYLGSAIAGSIIFRKLLKLP